MENDKSKSGEQINPQAITSSVPYFATKDYVDAAIASSGELPPVPAQNGVIPMSKDGVWGVSTAGGGAIPDNSINIEAGIVDTLPAVPCRFFQEYLPDTDPFKALLPAGKYACGKLGVYQDTLNWSMIAHNCSSSVTYLIGKREGIVYVNIMSGSGATDPRKVGEVLAQTAVGSLVPIALTMPAGYVQSANSRYYIEYTFTAAGGTYIMQGTTFAVGTGVTARLDLATGDAAETVSVKASVLTNANTSFSVQITDTTPVLTGWSAAVYLVR